MDWYMNVWRDPAGNGEFGVWKVRVDDDVTRLEDERYRVYATGLLFVDDQPLSLATAHKLANGTFAAIDGAGFAIIVDRQQQRILVVSDILGLCPAYRSRCGDYISSSADWIAARVSAEVVPEILAEFLVYGSVDRGRTYYDRVERFPAATLVTYSFSGELVAENRYFRHDEIPLSTAPADESVWRQRFFDGLRSSIRRLPGKDIGLLLSGGRDSRLVSSLLDGLNVRAVTFTDADGLEVDGARRVAHEHGFELTVIGRDDDYYHRILSDAVAATDGMFEYRHAYTLGLTDQIRSAIGDRPVISGCFFDLMFKGLSSRGTELWYDKLSALDGELFRQAGAARRERFEQVRGDPQRLERARCFPFSGLKTTAFRGTLLRSLNFVLLTAHRDLVRLFLEMPHEFKHDGFVRPERQAGEEGPRGMAWVKAYLNRHFPVLKQTAIRVGLRAPDRRSPWVPIEAIAHSDKARELLSGYREEIRYLEELLGHDGLFARAGSDPDPLYFRVITLAEWVRKNRYHIRQSPQRSSSQTASAG